MALRITDRFNTFSERKKRAALLLDSLSPADLLLLTELCRAGFKPAIKDFCEEHGYSRGCAELIEVAEEQS